MRGLLASVVLVGLLVGCYAPKLSTGAPCPDGLCPAGLVCSPATMTCERTAVAAPDAAIDAPADGAAPNVFGYRRRITIHNTAAAALPTGFTIRLPVGQALASLVQQGKANADLSDLRVVGDGSLGERDRIIDPAGGPAPPAVSFSLQAPIAAGAISTEYALYYGAPGAGPAPANGGQVFPVYDDFAGGIASSWLRNDGPITSAGKLVLRAGHTDALSTVAAGDGLPIVSAVEVLASVTDPTSDPTTQPEGTFFYWFGYQHTGDFAASEPWLIWVARGKGAIRAEQKSPVGCEAECNGPSATQDTAPHHYAIERDPGVTRFYLDGALAFTAAVTNQTDYAVMVRNYMATSDVKIDWIRARARVTPDPTTVVGAEERL
jgi:hypothetical protein